MGLYQDSFNRKRKQGTFRSFASSQFTPVTTITRPTTLPTPELTATTISDSQIDLSWPAVTGSRNYILWFNTVSNYGSATQIYAGSSTSFSHTGLTEGQIYYYYLTAVGRGINSGISTAQASTTDINFLSINSEDIFLVNNTDGLYI